MNTKIHVGNLAAETTAATIAGAFQQHGRSVLGVHLVMSREPGLSRGFAFVEVADEADAAASVTALHGSWIDGRQVRVAVAKPPRSPFGGFRRT